MVARNRVMCLSPQANLSDIVLPIRINPGKRKPNLDRHLHGSIRWINGFRRIELGGAQLYEIRGGKPMGSTAFLNSERLFHPVIMSAKRLETENALPKIRSGEREQRKGKHLQLRHGEAERRNASTVNNFTRDRIVSPQEFGTSGRVHPHIEARHGFD